METRTYTERSNARRAARAFGIDPETITETPEGFTFSLPAPKAEDDGLDIPAGLRLTAEQRRDTWERNPPIPAPVSANAITMPKPTKTKNSAKPSGADKNATLLKMLSGKGSSVEQLTKALDWLPHTLRARISRLAKPKSKGGEGLKIDRERKDGVTTYRITA